MHLPITPRWRGRIHQTAFFVSVPLGVALVLLARGAAAHVAAVVFAVSVSLVYGTSALYHRGNWSERARAVMRRLDHSMIFVLIAGSYTPLCLLALGPASGWGLTILSLSWLGAAIGITLTATRFDRMHVLGMVLYLSLGWLAVVALVPLLQRLSALEMLLMFTGGVLYTVGAVVIATNRPDPSPRVFGYHEVWHALVVGAGACHYTLVLLLVR